MKRKTEHPLQPVVTDEQGVRRFKKNAIVVYLLDAGPNDMNKLALIPFSREDREQFAQLIGYSVSGFGELSYVSDEAYKRACEHELCEASVCVTALRYYPCTKFARRGSRYCWSHRGLEPSPEGKAA